MFTLILEVITGIVIAIVFYNLIHHFLVVKPSKKHQLVAKDKTDLVIKSVVNNMINNNDIKLRNVQLIQSSVLSEAWGREVFAFEYSIPIAFEEKRQRKIFYDDFRRELKKYSMNHSMTIDNGKRSIFVVTDMWQYDHQIHLDVAYLKNQSTREYLVDLQKL